MASISGGKDKKGQQGELTGILKKMGYNEEQIFKVSLNILVTSL